MNFVVSSGELSKKLSILGKVIKNKNSMPILDNFLFKTQDNKLTIVASDLETTLSTSVTLERSEVNGSITVKAKLIQDIIKELPEQPITIKIEEGNASVSIFTQTGKYSLYSEEASNFPTPPSTSEEASKISLPASVLLCGIENTIFAIGTEELRPQINGTFLEFKENSLTFVATDMHKLVKIERTDIACDFEGSFILPSKPATLLKMLLLKEDLDAEISFDKKIAKFTTTEYTLTCSLIEGTYPAYNSVIPKDLPVKVTIDRVELINSLRRVSIFANQSSSQIKLEMNNDIITISAQDEELSTAGVDRIKCSIDGDNSVIAFKGTFLIELLSHLDCNDIVLTLGSPTRPGLITPETKESEEEEIVMLLMPMML